MAFTTAFLSALLLASFSATAQEITASLSGTVKDPTGAFIFNSTLTIINTDRNVVARVLRTSSSGHYAAPLLPGRHYDVSAAAPGFKTVRTSGIQLNVNDRRTIDFVLPVGTTSEEIIVEAESLHVNLETPAAAGLISGTQIRELAINTRNYAQLVVLQPGVSTSLASDQMYVGVSGPNGGTRVGRLRPFTVRFPCLLSPVIGLNVASLYRRHSSSFKNVEPLLEKGTPRVPLHRDYWFTIWL